MLEPVSVETFMELSGIVPVADVRSPSEFASGHIPGAINIPLFNDEERRIVGTLYKQKGRKEAIIKGFEFTGQKVNQLQNDAVAATTDGRLLLHCWRGGMRSAAMAWLFRKAGLQCEVLNGGYKAYRRYIRTRLALPYRLIVLGGMTGAGKTDILEEIRRQGYQTIDLELLAHHKGSAFGGLGEEEQLKNEQFENELLIPFLSLNRNQPVWIEDESRNIGKNIIPSELYEQMRVSPVIVLNMSRELRIERLVKDYGNYPPEQLVSCIERISKRIGGQNARQAVKFIESGDLVNVASITLQYYDKSYAFGLTRRPAENLHHLTTVSLSAKENAALILNYCATKNFI